MIFSHTNIKETKKVLKENLKYYKDFRFINEKDIIWDKLFKYPFIVVKNPVFFILELVLLYLLKL